MAVRVVRSQKLCVAGQPFFDRATFCGIALENSIPVQDGTENKYLTAVQFAGVVRMRYPRLPSGSLTVDAYISVDTTTNQWIIDSSLGASRYARILTVFEGNNGVIREIEVAMIKSPNLPRQTTQPGNVGSFAKRILDKYGSLDSAIRHVTFKAIASKFSVFMAPEEVYLSLLHAGGATVAQTAAAAALLHFGTPLYKETLPLTPRRRAWKRYRTGDGNLDEVCPHQLWTHASGMEVQVELVLRDTIECTDLYIKEDGSVRFWLFETEVQPVPKPRPQMVPLDEKTKAALLKLIDSKSLEADVTTMRDNL